jgi:hypothetical protein
MGQVYLRTVLPDASISQVPLSLGEPGATCTLRLRCLRGASAVHLAFTCEQGRVVARAEVPAEGDEIVVIEVEDGRGEGLRVRCRDRRVFTLPAEARYDPAPPLAPPRSGAPLDLVLVIDGTLRRFVAADRSEPLLANRALWHAQVERLVSFAAALGGQGAGSRFAVVAFGDRMPPGVVAADLRSEYVIFPRKPDERRFQELVRPRLLAGLEAVPATSGGDFVDALGDALNACRELRWREDARKVLLACGDSPGHSLEHPLRKGADASARDLDVDVEAWRLHWQGVEIATLYFDPDPALGLDRNEFSRDLLQGAREQYARLASLPELAFRASTFEPAAAAAALRDRAVLVGRWAALGAGIGGAAEAKGGI